MSKTLSSKLLSPARFVGRALRDSWEKTSKAGKIGAYLAGAGLISAATYLGYESGVIPVTWDGIKNHGQPLRYWQRTEDEVWQDAARVLRKKGLPHKAKLLEKFDREEFEQHLARKFGLVDEGIEGREVDYVGVKLRKKVARNKRLHDYNPIFNTFVFEGGFNETDLKHELTHTYGFFKETGLIERLRKRGPNVMLEEGLADMGAGYVTSSNLITKHTLNTLFLVYLLGVEPFVESQAGNLFERGKKIIGRAAFVERSTQEIRNKINSLTSNSYEDLIITPFDKRGKFGNAYSVFKILNFLEGVGVDYEDIFRDMQEQIIRSMQCSNPKISPSRAKKILRTASGFVRPSLVNMVKRDARRLEKRREIWEDLLSLYSSRSFGDEIRYVLAQTLIEDSNASEEKVKDALCFLKPVLKRTPDNELGANARYLYAREGRFGIIPKRELVPLLKGLLSSDCNLTMKENAQKFLRDVSY